jgi:hypothetical protein
MQPFEQGMERSLVYRTAAALFPEHPVKSLARFAGVTHSTAKTWAYGNKHWAYGNREPPIEVLKDLRGELQSALPAHGNQPVILDVVAHLDSYIWERERQLIKPRSGFNEIRERDGPGSTPRDGRNRLGRPRVRMTPIA